MTASNLTPFAFDDALVRIHADDNGNPWFVAKDVCRVLEIEWKGSHSIGSLDDDEKDSVILSTLGGDQQMLIVSESGLYALVFRSRKPETQRFRKWVTSEVLPAIRKTGSYAGPSVVLPEMTDAMKRLRPLMRERVLADAIQSARLTGLTIQEEIDALFLRYCAMIADAPENGRARLPGMAFARDTEGENIRRFADECLVPCRGNRVNATDMYVSFRSWWREQFDAALPSHHRFGRVMHEVCAKMRRGGSVYYVNVGLREAAKV